MYTTITGDLILRQPRPATPPRLWPLVKAVHTPAAWVILLRGAWGIPSPLVFALDTWAALWGCPSPEVRSWCQRLRAWPISPVTAQQLTACGLDPCEMVYIIEVAYLMGHLSLKATTILQTAILAHTGPEGHWKGETRC